MSTNVSALPNEDPGQATEEEEDVPEPEDEVDLVDDDVEAEDAESVESRLPAACPVLVVGAARHPGERLAHRIPGEEKNISIEKSINSSVPGVLQHDLLGRQTVEAVDVPAVGQEVAAYNKLK